MWSVISGKIQSWERCRTPGNTNNKTCKKNALKYFTASGLELLPKWLQHHTSLHLPSSLSDRWQHTWSTCLDMWMNLSQRANKCYRISCHPSIFKNVAMDGDAVGNHMQDDMHMQSVLQRIWIGLWLKTAPVSSRDSALQQHVLNDISG